MRKIWLVMKREYVTRVKTKGFVIATLIVPLSGVLIVALIVFIASHGSDHNARLVIVDNAGGLAASTAERLKGVLSNGKPEFTISESIDRPASPDEVQQGLRARINSGALDAYLVIPGDLNRPFEFHTKNPGNLAVLAPMSAAVNQTLIEARLRARGIHVDDISELARGANLEVIKVSQAGESVEKGQTLGVGVGLVILLYMSLLMYGVTTMRSVLEEKTSRTMEVLISSVRPVQLLAGKILGVAGAAFTQFLIWIVSIGLLLSYGATMAAMFGSGSSFPKIHVPISLLVWAGCFFMGGYFLYSAMFAAIGSACSSEEDAQQLQWLAMGPLLFTMMIYWAVLVDPSSKASFVLSEIPFSAPVLMPLRISVQAPPVWQIALSIILLLLTTVGAIYASAKIYRVGVLMYGKRPTIPELVRWLRYS